MGDNMPDEMLAVVVKDKNGTIGVERIPAPKPGPGEVLVKMAAAPINPSDLGFLKGSYGFSRPFPVVPGFEGSGTVVAAGKGLLPKFLLGKRVACGSMMSKNGSWAEYMVTTASSCFKLSKKLSLEEGAALIVNPLTAVALIRIAKENGHRAIINNAASGALGKMILKLAVKNNISVINIVRKEEYVSMLSLLGADYTLDSSSSTFLAELNQLAGKLKPTLILDPVGGEMTQVLLNAVPKGSTALVYGTLSGREPDLSLKTLSLEDKHLEGFFLPNWLSKQSLFTKLSAARTVQKLAQKELSTNVNKRFKLTEINEAIALYQQEPTKGKILLKARN